MNRINLLSETEFYGRAFEATTLHLFVDEGSHLSIYSQLFYENLIEMLGRQLLRDLWT